MKVLIITAHPAKYGFTHKIATTYKKEKEDRGDEVFIMDLYKKKYAQPFLDFENPKEFNGSPATRKNIQEKILWADELVFVFPIWWVGPPAIMKNFFDQNFTAGFAYKYTDCGLRKELLEGRTARMFSTADGPRLVYLCYQYLMRVRWGKGVFGYCGIELTSLDIFSNMIKRRNDCEHARMLRRVAMRAHEKLPIHKKAKRVREVSSHKK